MPGVSIIIPVYNVQKYLKKCLESVIRQTMKDIEIIIINDGSIDNSLEICRQYSKNDKRIKLIDKKNEGVSKARNTGILHATGKYICFVDSDDWIESNMIENLYNFVLVNDSDFCMCNFIKENESKCDYVRSNLDKKVLNENEIKKHLLIPLIERDDNEKEHILARFRTPWGKLFKRDIIEKYNIRFKEDLIIGEDFLFNLDFLIHANKVIISDKFHYHYINNTNSATMKYKDDCWKNTYKNIIIYLED
ncbi:glycosyltransferase family 2 protein, partial [Clostridium beijerinckii]|uniref:glycosyltransferase family 2 protein n=1 Tax=Clostridium beijerinckii TaxID=1520 RepID=UPI0022E71FB6